VIGKLARRSGLLGGASFAATPPVLMSEEEHPAGSGRGPSLTGPLILAALIGVGIILAAIAAVWLVRTMNETIKPRIHKRAKVSRPSGQWGDDDYDVILSGRSGRAGLPVARCAARSAMDVDAGLRLPRRPHTDSRL
jgi:hypothetical protein